MYGLTVTMLLLISAVLLALLYDYVGPLGFILLLIVAALGNAYDKHKENRRSASNRTD